MPAGQRVFLQVRGGAFRRVTLSPGESVRVGRTSLADFAVPDDDQLSQIHFELSWDGAVCQARDLGGAGGLFVGGQPVETAAVRPGGWLRAGRTDFSVFFEDTADASPSPGENTESARSVLQALQQIARRKTLFAVLDAARSERIVPLLRTAADEHGSLYEGLRAETMEDAAPYLVHFAPESRLLPRLVLEGWGDSWGILVDTPATFRDLRAHFRRLLVVTREKDALPMYFRFYDPRVLRGFLPVATQRQVEVMFGPIDRFLTEGVNGDGLRSFGRSSPGVLEERSAL